jgi:cation diffusion facilitator CzcD-associated flavoprotein CzcO
MVAALRADVRVTRSHAESGAEEPPTYPAIVVGAGPAGLAASRELAARGVEHLVLEAASIGSSWAGYYRSLVLHTGKHLSHLPGLRIPRDVSLFPPRDRFLAYLREYAAHFDLPVREGVRVLTARVEEDGGWMLDTSAGGFRTGALIVATGIASGPHRPTLEGEEDFGGEILHSSAYVEPSSFRGRRLLVVGVGNSGGEIAGELAAAGVDVAVSVRSGTHLMPLRILGIPSQYWGSLFGVFPGASEGIARVLAAVRRLVAGPPPLPIPDRPLLARPPLIGDALPSAIRSGQVRVRGAIECVLPGAVRFIDGIEEPFDAIVLATGYRAAVEFLRGAVTLDAEGFPLREGVRSPELQGLFFVGHRYESSGALAAIRSDARQVAREAAALANRSGPIADRR